MAHDIEDVDTGRLTPWELDQIHAAMTSLRRHGYEVQFSKDGRAVTWPALEPVPPPAPEPITDSARTYARALQLKPIKDALLGAMVNDGIVASEGFDVVGPQHDPATCPCDIHAHARAGKL